MGLRNMKRARELHVYGYTIVQGDAIYAYYVRTYIEDLALKFNAALRLTN